MCGLGGTRLQRRIETSGWRRRTLAAVDVDVVDDVGGEALCQLMVCLVQESGAWTARECDRLMQTIST